MLYILFHGPMLAAWKQGIGPMAVIQP